MGVKKLVDYDAVRDALCVWCRDDCPEGECNQSVCSILKALDAAVADDAAVVSVVRCKDCKHRGNDIYCPMCFEETIEYDDDGYMETDFVVRDYTSDEGFCDCGEKDDDSGVRMVGNAPTVDAVPVVRCGECRWSRDRNESEAQYLMGGILICSSPDASDCGWNPVYPEHYCSYGERRPS